MNKQYAEDSSKEKSIVSLVGNRRDYKRSRTSDGVTATKLLHITGGDMLDSIQLLLVTIRGGHIKHEQPIFGWFLYNREDNLP